MGAALAAPDFLFGLEDFVTGVSLGFGGEPIVPVFGLNCRRRFGCAAGGVSFPVSFAGVLIAVLDTAELGRAELLVTPSTTVSPLSSPSTRGEGELVPGSGARPMSLGAGGEDFRFLGGRPRRFGSVAAGLPSEGWSTGATSIFRFGCFNFSNAFIWTGAGVFSTVGSTCDTLTSARVAFEACGGGCG